MTKRLKWLITAAFVVIGIIILFSSRMPIDFNNLTVEQLIDGGYYAYIIPPSLFENGVNYHIRMRSFDFHCDRGSSEDTWNYVRISYNFIDGTLFGITISQNDAYFDDRRGIKININLPYSINGVAEYYQDRGLKRIRFIDPNLNDVVIITNRHSFDLIELIYKLQPIGVFNNTNPFVKACQ